MLRSKLFALTGFFAATTFPPGAYAETLPGTPIISENNLLHAETVGNDGIIRTARGELLQLTQEGAIKACADQNMRLPTLRELAEMSELMGARGILKTSQVEEGKAPTGFFLVSGINPNGNSDEFYFNLSGYYPASEDIGRSYFWSSSYYSPSSDVGYALNGANSVFNAIPRSLPLGVRCVVGRTGRIKGHS